MSGKYTKIEYLHDKILTTLEIWQPYTQQTHKLLQSTCHLLSLSLPFSILDVTHGIARAHSPQYGIPCQSYRWRIYEFNSKRIGRSVWFRCVQFGSIWCASNGQIFVFSDFNFLVLLFAKICMCLIQLFTDENCAQSIFIVQRCWCWCSNGIIAREQCSSLLSFTSQRCCCFSAESFLAT